MPRGGRNAGRLALCCKQDYLDLFDGIPFGEVSVSNSAPAVFAVAGLAIAAREADFPLAKLRGSVLLAPLYTEDCTYATHLPVEFRTRLSLDCVEFCTRHMPKFHGYLEDTYFFSESGLDPVEEMALGFVQIRHITRRLIARGVDIDLFAPRIALLVNCGMDFFEEVAKIRATRRLFAKMMREEFGATDPRSMSVAITSHTSGLSLTAQQPVNNIVRGTTQALALVMSGVQAIEISAFDEAFRTPSKEAHLVGLRTQQIIDLESGVAKVLDPLGGSYLVEHLTGEMEVRIRARIDELEAMGELEELCRRGVFREIFHRAMETNHMAVERGEASMVGVNVHRMAEADDTMLRDIASAKIETWHEHTAKIEAFKRTRDQDAARRGLAGIATATQGTDNLVEAIIAAFDAGATVGEITTTMRKTLGCPPDSFDHALPERTMEPAHGT